MRHRVLIVDDEPSMRMLASFALHAECCEIVGEVCDGYAAIEAAAELKPDLIVLDHLMPRLSGVDALPTLRRLCPDARIVLWTMAPELAAAARTERAELVDKDIDALVSLVCQRSMSAA